MMNSLEDIILENFLIDAEKGRTWRQLEEDLLTIGIKKDHGNISGSLSKLHERGDVFSLLARAEDGCVPYFHIKYRSKFSEAERKDKIRKSKWLKVANTLYEAMTNIDTTNKQWDEALALYEKTLDD
jgi:hypothetical protein